MPPVALSGYLGISGANLHAKDGVHFFDRDTRLQVIVDGSSNTLLVGERLAGEPYVFSWWYAGIGQFMPRKPGSRQENLPQRIYHGTFTGSAAQTLGAAELNMQSSGCSQYDNCLPGPYTYGPGRQDNVGADLVKLTTRGGGEVYNDW